MSYFPESHVHYEAHTVEFWAGLVCRNVRDPNYVLVFVNDKNDSMFVPRTKSRRLPTCKSHRWRHESQLESANRLARALFDVETYVLDNVHSGAFNRTLHTNPFLVELICEKNGTAEVMRWSLGSYDPTKPIDKLLDKPEREGSWVIQEVHWFDALHHVRDSERRVLEAAIRAFQRQDEVLISRPVFIGGVPNAPKMKRRNCHTTVIDNLKTRDRLSNVGAVSLGSGSDHEPTIRPGIPSQDAASLHPNPNQDTHRSLDISHTMKNDPGALNFRNKPAKSVPKSVRDRVKAKRRGRARKLSR